MFRTVFLGLLVIVFSFSLIVFDYAKADTAPLWELTPTSEPTPTPQPIDWSICQSTDSPTPGIYYYIEPEIGVKRRLLPAQISEYIGVAAQNTKVIAECKREIDIDNDWYRVADQKGSFWVKGEWLSQEAIEQPSSSLSSPPVYRGKGSITLSFDDSAPLERVSAILDVLDQKRVKAVFCVWGGWARSNPGLINRIREKGHALCNHTAHHADLTKLSDELIQAEIAGGAFPDDGGRLRPPYGAFNSRVQSIAASMGYFIYMWSIDTRDWTGRSVETILNEVLSNLHPGAIVLMHLHGANTLAALPLIIDGIQAAGYTIGY